MNTLEIFDITQILTVSRRALTSSSSVWRAMRFLSRTVTAWRASSPERRSSSMAISSSWKQILYPHVDSYHRFLDFLLKKCFDVMENLPWRVHWEPCCSSPIRRWCEWEFQLGFRIREFRFRTSFSSVRFLPCIWSRFQQLCVAAHPGLFGCSCCKNINGLLKEIQELMRNFDGVVQQFMLYMNFAVCKYYESSCGLMD